jgi:hypothetical protein
MNRNEMQKFLDAEPKPEEISLNNGKTYLDIDVVKRKLNHLAELIGGYWADSNFQYSYNLVNNAYLISGSIQLTIYNSEGKVFRSFSGGSNATIESFNDSNIDQYVGSINSMALTFAARKLGASFGGNLYAKEKGNVDEYGEKFIQVKETDETPKKDKDIYNALMGTIKMAKTKSQAQRILSAAPFPYCIDDDLQNTVNTLK